MPRKKRTPVKLTPVSGGERVQPVRRGYLMGCCDCGLVHRLDFKLVKYGDGKSKIRFRAFRDERATADVRTARKRKEAKHG